MRGWQLSENEIGGNALSYASVRLTKNNYDRVEADRLAKLKALYPEGRPLHGGCHPIPQALPEQVSPLSAGTVRRFQLGYTKCDYLTGGHMTWLNPTPYRLIPTEDSESFKTMPTMATGLPLPPHPGAFGVQRKMHFHEGVDLYLPTSTPIIAVEEGEVIEVRQFTGPELGQPWWRKTWAVWVQGPSGVVVYGEIAPHIKVGAQVNPGTLLGVVIPVLTKDKGRPMSMAHIELHSDGSKEAPEWLLDVPRPAVLRDPTPFLLECV